MRPCSFEPLLWETRVRRLCARFFSFIVLLWVKVLFFVNTVIQKTEQFLVQENKINKEVNKCAVKTIGLANNTCMHNDDAFCIRASALYLHTRRLREGRIYLTQ